MESPTTVNSSPAQEKQRKQSVARSDDTFSTFSSFGERFVEDTIDDTITMPPTTIAVDDVRHIADLIAKFSGNDVHELMPKVMELCRNSQVSPVSCSHVVAASVDRSGTDTNPVKGAMVKAKPSQPELASERRILKKMASERRLFRTDALDDERRFSFDCNDETAFHSFGNDTAVALPGQSLHRSQSVLETWPNGRSPRQPDLQLLSRNGTSPGLGSPRPTNPVPLSRIPSPVTSGPLARQRRDESISSVRTAVRHRQSSTSSLRSDYSSSSNAAQPVFSSTLNESPQRTSNRSSNSSGRMPSGQRLVDEKQNLRTNSLALAAARAAGNTSSQSSLSDMQGQRQRQSKHSSSYGSSTSLTQDSTP